MCVRKKHCVHVCLLVLIPVWVSLLRRTVPRIKLCAFAPISDLIYPCSNMFNKYYQIKSKFQAYWVHCFLFLFHLKNKIPIMYLCTGGAKKKMLGKYTGSGVRGIDRNSFLSSAVPFSRKILAAMGRSSGLRLNPRGVGGEVNITPSRIFVITFKDARHRHKMLGTLSDIRKFCETSSKKK